MWQLNGPAANYLVACMAFLLAFSLIFAFRDTIRALAEFFDIRAIRRVFRNHWAVVLMHGGLVVLLVLYQLVEDPRDLGLAIILAGLFLVPGLSLTWLLVTDAAEAFGPRKRRRRLPGNAPLPSQSPMPPRASAHAASSLFNRRPRRSNH